MGTILSVNLKYKMTAQEKVPKLLVDGEQENYFRHHLEINKIHICLLHYFSQSYYKTLISGKEKKKDLNKFTYNFK